jgi:hypothetical protein
MHQDDWLKIKHGILYELERIIHSRFGYHLIEFIEPERKAVVHKITLEERFDRLQK